MHIPRIIWIYWDKNPTKLIQKIRKHNQPFLKTWTVHYLDAKTVKKYIASYPEGFNTLIPQHKSDWIRSFLLTNHGGCWCDASIVFNASEEIHVLWTKSNQIKSDFTGFYKTSVETLYNVVDKIPTKIENWFFMVPIKSKVMLKWLDEFTHAIKIGLLHYRNSLVGKINLHIYYPCGITDDAYLVHHMALQVAIRSLKPSPVLLLLDADNTMFKLRKQCFKLHAKSKHNRSVCVMNKMKNKTTRRIPFIKLSGFERDTGININSAL